MFEFCFIDVIFCVIKIIGVLATQGPSTTYNVVLNVSRENYKCAYKFN